MKKGILFAALTAILFVTLEPVSKLIANDVTPFAITLWRFIIGSVMMLPFAILDEILHPVTLAMRLYGNIHGEETVVHELFNLTAAAPWAPGVMEVLGMLFGLIQALVFSLLAAIYISEAAEHEE
jgi:F0F1-type ATP synthase membrane subunit a